MLCCCVAVLLGCLTVGAASFPSLCNCRNYEVNDDLVQIDSFEGWLNMCMMNSIDLSDSRCGWWID